MGLWVMAAAPAVLAYPFTRRLGLPQPLADLLAGLLAGLLTRSSGSCEPGGGDYVRASDNPTPTDSKYDENTLLAKVITAPPGAPTVALRAGAAIPL